MKRTTYNVKADDRVILTEDILFGDEVTPEHINQYLLEWAAAHKITIDWALADIDENTKMNHMSRLTNGQKIVDLTSGRVFKYIVDEATGAKAITDGYDYICLSSLSSHLYRFAPYLGGRKI